MQGDCPDGIRAVTEYRYFNLDELLGDEYVRHYLRFINGTGNQFYVNTGTVTGTVSAAGWNYDDWPARPLQADVVMRRGSGPDYCSSSTVLAVSPEVCWDVCGYYRRLGVHWKATRLQLRIAYIKRGGPVSRSLTYALHQLLDKELRAVYDRMPLGGLFLADRDVQEGLKRAAAAMAARMAACGRLVSSEDVLRDWGFGTEPGKPEASSREQAQAAAGQLAPDPDETLGSSISDWSLDWSYYVMSPRDPGESGDLPAWQDLLREAFRIRGLPSARFAVGICSGADYLIWRRMSPDAGIILLGIEPPTLSLALRAAAEWMAHR